MIVKARFKAMLPMFLLMGIAFVAAPFAVDAWLGYGLGLGFATGAVLAVLVEQAYFVLFFSRIMHAGHDVWREELRARLMLPADGPFSFVMYFPRRPRIWNLSVPFDAAFMAEGTDGLVFLGDRVRLRIPFAALRGAGTRRVIFNPPRTTVELDVDTGQRYFAFLEKNTFRANRALAVACAERIRARLSVPGGAREAAPPSP